MKISTRVALLLLFTCIFLHSFSQTVLSTETFPSAFNTDNKSPINTGFTENIGRWLGYSTDSYSIVSVDDKKASSGSYALKLQNNRTANYNKETIARATSPIASCTPQCAAPVTIQFKVFALNVNPANTSFNFYLDISKDNGSNWSTLFTKSASQIINTYGSNKWADVTVNIPAAYYNSSFRYRFLGIQQAGCNYDNCIYVDDVKIVAGACTPTPPSTPPTTAGCPGNIATNADGYYGGFEAGKSNISSTTGGSDLKYQLPGDGSYEIAKSVNDLHGGGYRDIHPHSGDYFLAAHTSNKEEDRVWYTKINVTPGATYNFCTYVTLLKNLGQGADFIVGLYANGVSIGTGKVTSDWTQICGTVKVPAGVTTLELSIRDPKKGLFFVAIDDICITGTTPAQGKLTLGNLVWNDVNGDGIKQADEAGVGSVPLKLYTDNNGDNVADDNTPAASTTTAADGSYKFSGLMPGRYIVGLIIPTGYTVPPTRFGNPDNDVDNDNNAINVVNSQSEVRTNAITLASGTEPMNDGDDANGNLTLDLAICGRSTIGDFVWKDLNGNGIQDQGEPGIANVKVTLTYPDGTSTSKTTDANGKYSFINLGPGIHKVTFTTPSGYNASPANQGSDDAKDSDPVNGVVTVNVIATTTDNSIDAGFVTNTPPVANLRLGNLVWNDRDGDGKRDPNEPAIGGVTVSLYTDNDGDNLPDGAAIKTTQSDAHGHYLFTDLAPGRYIASMPILPGYQQDPNTTTQTISPFPDLDVDNVDKLVRLVGPNAPGGVVYSNAITLSGGDEPTTDGDDANGNLTFDLAECGNSFIGDFVWNDLNGNGIQDAGEPGINGVKVTLTFPDGTVATETTHNYNATNNQNAPQYDGYYDFKNLGPGTYTVSFEKPAGYDASPANQGNNDAKDSDPVNGGAVSVTIIADHSDFTIDAGFTKYTPPVANLRLGNLVWNDRDGDGKRDPNEPAIGGVTVSLYTDNDGDNLPDGAAIKTTQSDAHGHYLFTDLAPGRYIASMPILPGYQQDPNTTTQTISPFPDLNVDNVDKLVRLVGPNAPGGVVYSNAITLSGGDEPTTDGDDANGNLTFDLAECGNSFIGDFVWNDLNGNGIQDAGEPGINGVKVTLTFPDGTVATETTHNYNATNNQNAPQYDGYYDFKNLGPGTYTVSFEKPAGYDASPANQGNDDAKDSDPVNGGAVSVTITADHSDFTIDAGFTKYTPPVANLRLGNLIWNDRDGDGKRDPNEPAIGGVTVSLYTDNDGDNLPDGAAIKTTQSDAHGHYLFTDLAPGRYIASMPILPGYQQDPNTTTQTISPFPDLNVDNVDKLVRLVGPNAPGGVVYSNAITLSAGDEPTTDGDDANGNLTFDLAECGNSFIGDFVWNDLNGNGIQDAGEPGINGVKVTLTFPDGTVATETTHNYNATNNQNAPQYDGYYDFKNLGPGTYTVSFEKPAGYNASPANQGGNDAKDSDPVNGGAVSVTITADHSDFTIDAGFIKNTPTTPLTTCPNLSLGNMVFNDENGNGLKERREPGIGGLLVSLYADNNNDNLPDGAAIATVITAEDGGYYFGNLAEGKYIVGVMTGTNYSQGSNGNATPNDNKDNDNNGVRTVNGEVRSNNITLSPGDEPINDGSDNNSNLTLDFGLKLLCTNHCDCHNDCNHTNCGHLNCGPKVDGGRSADLSGTTISIFPNPAAERFTLKVDAEKSGEAVARITDGSGHLVTTKNITLTAGANTISFNDLSKLNPGSYNVQLLFNYNVYNQPLMIGR